MNLPPKSPADDCAFFELSALHFAEIGTQVQEGGVPKGFAEGKYKACSVAGCTLTARCVVSRTDPAHTLIARFDQSGTRVFDCPATPPVSYPNLKDLLKDL